jgi:hypothetical protein
VNSESRPWSAPQGSLALETEPFVFFHPILGGTAAPGGVQPVGRTPLLEEEPSTWPECGQP